MEAGSEREEPRIVEYTPGIYRPPHDEEEDELRDGLRAHHLYDLNKHTLEYITHLPGDTAEDDRRMQQYAALDDDVQSIEDGEYYARREQEEREDPQGTYWHRSEYEGHEDEME
eukprot:4168397-Amphidinium_carterae.1